MSQAIVDPEYRVTLVIEWENIRVAEAARCTAMLAELGRQIEAFSIADPASVRDFEMIVTFDEEQFSETDLRSFVSQAMPRPPARVSLRFLAGRGLGYYELKNLGVRAARGGFVVFLDSDVIPEPGWLSRLLASFDDPRVDVVCGNCSLETGDLVSKALALGWFFPLRDPHDALVAQDWFFANNVAFRRQLVARYPFETVAGSSRGSCQLLSRRLRADGRAIFVNTGARVRHPAPHGAWNLLRRGLAHGRDELLIARIHGGGSLGESVSRAARLQARAWRRLFRHRREVGLGVAGVPVALSINALYYALYAAGDVATRIAPRWTDTNLRI
ncbi:MAG: glycosyltransferase [Planctomycetaceae bacterium]|nr:glycosyltransferase [Planctomycetaceae bacterium]